MRALTLTLLLVVGCDGTENASTSAPTAGASGAAATMGTGGAGGATTTSAAGAGGATGGAGGGTGGQGGAGAAGGAGGEMTSSTTGTGGGGPGPCVWGDDCGAGYYCLAPDCGAGMCVQKPFAGGQPPQPDPVCGCDGVTYWNKEVAASLGASVAATGSCSMPIACSPNMGCPPGMKCNREVADKVSCSPDVMGQCWGTPIQCSLDGPKARACSNDTCELQCSLVQSQNPWFADPTCN